MIPFPLTNDITYILDETTPKRKVRGKLVYNSNNGPAKRLPNGEYISQSEYKKLKKEWADARKSS